MENNKKRTSPWAWVSTLYFAEGLPNYIVSSIVPIFLLVDMGLTDTQITYYTGYLQLPWILKPFWSPFIDIFKTKRWWIITMQAFLGAAFTGVAFTLDTSFWFQSLMFLLMCIGFFSATYDIAADGYYMIELDSHEQSFFVGIRNTAYRIAGLLGTPALVFLAGAFQRFSGGRIAYGWSLAFWAVVAVIILLALFHARFLPHSEGDKSRYTSFRETGRLLGKALSTFFTKFPVKETVIAILFLLIFRLPEAMLSKIGPMFLQRPEDVGGLAIDKETCAWIYSTLGAIGMLLGGILGSYLASRDGVKKWLWPMVLALTLPDLVYVYLSYATSPSIATVTSCIFVEQFGYGFGFLPLTLYMLFYSAGEFKTSHYSLCTGITYLGLTVPGMFSGYLADHMGYRHFFLLVIGTCIITFLMAAIVKIDPEFGKKKNA